MNTITLRAHFDGDKIVLDEPYDLKQDARLIVTVLPQEASDPYHAEWLALSQDGLARAYGEDEPEYTLEMIKRPNSEYERR